MVPLNLHFGTTTFKDGIDISVDDFYDRLINTNEFPTTSQPSVGDFLEKYKEIIDNSDGIVSIHISSKLSGTFNSAIQARDSLDRNNKIEVIDHIVANVELDKMDYWKEFYEKIFGFSTFVRFDETDISTKYSALKSVVVRSKNWKISFKFNEASFIQNKR